MHLKKYIALWVMMILVLSTLTLSVGFTARRAESKIIRESSGQESKKVLDDNIIEKLNSKSEEEKIEVVIRLTPEEFESKEKTGPLNDMDNERVVTELKEHSERKQADLKDMIESNGGEILNSFWIANAVLAEVKIGTLNELVERPDVWRVHENFELDIKGSSPTGLIDDSESIENSDEMTWGLDRIDVERAWEEGKIWEDGFDGADVRVAVSDTGVDIEHPDLKGKMVTTEEENEYYPGGWIEFDEDGHVVENSTPRDTHEHGTHVSGTIMGGNASGKHIGVAPGAKLMHALVFQEGTGEFSQMMASFEWKVEPHDRFGNPLHEEYGGDVEDYRPHIASMSWSATGYWSTFEEPIQNLRNSGIIPVAAAGNGGEATADSPGAIYETFGIGASEENDDIAWFSSGDIVEDEREETPERYVKPDFAAPGTRVESSVPGDDWRSLSGTSMATPHVAGTVALMLDADPDLSADEIYETLDMSSDYYLAGDMLPDRKDKNTRYGHGIINAGKAVDCVSSLAIRRPEDVGKHTALLSAEVLDMPTDELDVFFRYREEGEEAWTETEPETITEQKIFEIRIDGLNENTEYEYKAVAETSGEEETTFTITFSTHRDVEIFTWIPENMTASNATLKGSISDMYIEEAEVFFRYRETDQEGWAETPSVNISEPKNFEAEIFDLDYMKSYEYQAVALSDEDEFTGDFIEFTTDLPEPEWDEDRRAYLVSNVGELQWMENEPRRDIILQNDINASKTEGWYNGAGFRPIGDQKGFYSFRGDLEGQGYVIKNLYIHRPMRDNVGLFGVNYNPSETDRRSEIRNVSLVDANVTGRDNVGALVGWNEGDVNESYADGKVRGEDNVGGLAGRNGEIERAEGYVLEGKVIDSTSGVNVSGEERVGGLAGWSVAGEITDSSAEGEVVAEGDYVGGLVGEAGIVTESYATGNVIGKGDYVGGLVGNASRVTSSFSKGAVTGKGNFTGGLGGVILSAVRDSYSAGEVEGANKVGGLVGMLGSEESYYSRINRSHAVGGVSGEEDVGGLVGNNLGYELSNSFYHEDMPDCDVEDYGSLPLSDEEFSSISTFSSAGWDIEMVETHRDYPYLSMETGEGDAAWLIQESEQTYNFTIDSQEGGSTDPPEGTHTYYEHGKIVLEAVRDDGYYPAGWSGDVESKEKIIPVTADEDKQMTALFEEVDEEISDWEQLRNIRYKLDGDFTLESDLDRDSEGYEDHVETERGWDPIGGYVQNEFTGRFDGQSYEIKDLVIDRPSERFVGLFAVTSMGASIENISLSNVDIKGAEDEDFFRPGVGALVGNNRGYVSNSHVTGNISGEINVGGLIGYNDMFGEVSNSSTRGTVSGNSQVGGLVGGLVGYNSGSIDNSSSAAEVSGEGSIAGLVGRTEGTISNSFATGSVKGVGHVGGLIGINLRGSKVTNSYSTGNVTGEVNVGGLIGFNQRVADPSALIEISGSYATGNVTGDENVGGLVGVNQVGCTEISRSFSAGEVSGESQVGGLIGHHAAMTELYDSYALGAVQGNQQVGGLIGFNNGSVSTSYAAVEIGEAEDIGGLIGKSGEEAQVEASFWDTERSGIEKSDGGAGLTTREMTGEPAVENMDAFDFDQIWKTVEKTQDDVETDGYPILQAITREDQLEFVQVEPPSVITREAKNVTSNSAVLHGELTDLGAADEIDVYFQYREEGNQSWTETRRQTLTEPRIFNETISGLRADTVYEFGAAAEGYQIEEGEVNTVETDQMMYELTIEIEGKGDVEIDPEQNEYEEGTEITLSAVTAEGWSFSDWTGDYEGEEAEIEFTIEEDMEITAHFEEEDDEDSGFPSGFWWPIGLVVIAVVTVLILKKIKKIRHRKKREELPRLRKSGED
ncbi:MAG: S8 family serine peptidase [Candidatus Thermoplasmatota archaeon]